MRFFRMVKKVHIDYVQSEDVEADSPEAAVALWNEQTAVPHTQYDHGYIKAIEMVDMPDTAKDATRA